MAQSIQDLSLVFQTREKKRKEKKEKGAGNSKNQE